MWVTILISFGHFQNCEIIGVFDALTEILNFEIPEGPIITLLGVRPEDIDSRAKIYLPQILLLQQSNELHVDG